MQHKVAPKLIEFVEKNHSLLAELLLLLKANFVFNLVETKQFINEMKIDKKVKKAMFEFLDQGKIVLDNVDKFSVEFNRRDASNKNKTLSFDLFLTNYGMLNHEFSKFLEPIVRQIFKPETTKVEIKEEGVKSDDK